MEDFVTGTSHHENRLLHGMVLMPPLAVLGPLGYGANVWAGADGVWLAQRPSVTSLLQLPRIIVDLSVYPLPPLGCLDHHKSADLAWRDHSS